MQVVYVAGWMRSGTTLMSELLGAQPDVFNAGEVSGIWAAAARGGLCSCGYSLLECPVWGRSIQSVDAEEGVDPGCRDEQHAAWGSLTAEIFRTRNASRLRQWADHASVAPSGYRTVRRVTTSLLSHAMALTGATALIDSSKLVPGILFYKDLADVRLSVVHVVRDPRAVAASELRTAHLDSGNAEFLPPGSDIAKSLAHWYGANISVAVTAQSLRLPSIRVHYEHLAVDLAKQMRRAADAVGLQFDPALIDGQCVDLGAQHVAVGNPSRSPGGITTVTLDERWRSELQALPKLITTIAAAPAIVARLGER